MRPTPAPSRRATVLMTAAALTAGLVATAQPSDATIATKFGAVVKPEKGTTYQSALATSENRYGRLGVIRYFDNNTPDDWSSLSAKLTDHNAIVSFRMPPSEVNSGQHDALLSKWFADAPRDRVTWFTYLHEPEDNIARGEFKLDAYRAATRRVFALAHAAGNSRLRSTQIFMCYTVNPKSGRNWRDYFVGASYVDALGWDCYDHGFQDGGYGQPENLFGNAVAATKKAGVAFGVAEMGSLVVPGDDGTGRAAWLKASAKYLYQNNAAFVSYFDTNGAGTDYRLTDTPSKRAWRSVVIDQTP